MEQEEERSAANKLKSKAIKEAKLLLKLEGKSTKLVRKVEVKLKPQSETTGYTSGYVKKPAVSSSSYDKIKQQQKQVQKEYEEKQVLNAIIESFQSVKITDNNEVEEFVESLDAKKISSTVNQAMKSERKPVKSIVARTTDSVSTGSPVYVKLKRREESYDDEEEEEEEEKRNFSSLEALDDRMDELYGELDSKSEFPVPVDLSPKIPVASYNDGSDSKNPIKWRNGRLVSDKDRFFESMKANAESELELELEMNGNRSEKTENNESENNNEKSGENKKKISALPVNKKIVVELTGVTMKKMLEHLEVSIGFEGLYEETNLRCFSVKPSITSSLKVLRQAPLEWARKKIEYLYIQSMKRL